MPEVERTRAEVADRLGTAYARGHLATGSLELRLADVLRAAGEAGVQEGLWGLPPARRSARSRLRGWWDGEARAVDTALAFVLAGDDGPVLVGSGPRSAWLLGRSSLCDRRIRDASVSRRHARIWCRAGQWSVEDLGSSNGTRVNGERVTRATLAPGDVVHLGLVRAALVPAA